MKSYLFVYINLDQNLLNTLFELNYNYNLHVFNVFSYNFFYILLWKQNFKKIAKK